METFYNRQRPNYEEITSYTPKWLLDFKELDANFRYAGWTLDLMAEFLERIIRNQHPNFADEQTIRMLEKILQIDYDPNASLDERRTLVKAYYFGTEKLSASVIKDMIKSYTGFNSEVIRNGSAFLFDIDCNGTFSLFGSKIFRAIARRMPAHLECGFKLRENTTAGIGYAVVTKEYKKIAATVCVEENPLENLGWIVDERLNSLCDENGRLLME